jgi:hypothetical protein
MDKAVIQQRLFLLCRSLARDTSTLVALFDKYRSSKEPRFLLDAAAVGCRSLEGLQDSNLSDILDMLYTHVEESLPVAQRLFESKEVFDDFLLAEYSLLYLVGTSREAAHMIVDECKRLRGEGLEPRKPQLLLHAFDLLKEEICKAEDRLESENQQSRVKFQFGGWTLIFANGVLAAAATAGAPFSLGLTLGIGGGTAASIAFGGKMVSR